MSVVAIVALCSVRRQLSLSHVGRCAYAVEGRIKDGYRNGIKVPFVRAMMTTGPSYHRKSHNDLARSMVLLVDKGDSAT